jgi:predicted ATPase/DNA-binding SARP family transcriptional activator
LGPVEATIGGRAVRLAQGHQRALLAILLLNANRSVSVEDLIDGLWVDPPRTARTALHGMVAALRRALHDAGGESTDALLVLTPSGYMLRVEDLDLARFEQLVAEAERARTAGRLEEAAQLLAEAEALWRGPPLADVSSAPFAGAQVVRLAEARLAAIEERIEIELLQGRHAAVLGQLSALVAKNRMRERLRGQLMLALYRSGRQADALAAYRDARSTLVEEQGLEPSPELRRLHQAILEQSPDLEPADRQPPLRLGSEAPGFASPATRLIGRRRELECLRTLLSDPEVRLITLTGVGGIGKTRLALAVLEQAVEAFPDGASVVLLGGVRDPELVASSIAQRLGVEEDVGSLEASLASRRMLLLLDNFEQVLAAAPLIPSLLEAAPGLKLLVTSRAPLRIGSEREFSVPPLSLPSPDSPEPALESDAVALFVDRARRADPEFDPKSKDLETIVEICHRLDALPLALELAAARLRILSTSQLRDRLTRALPLLTGGLRDAPERHQTLRATLDWSYQLLEPSAQQAFCHLSVFVGGFSLEAALAVCTERAQPEVGLLDDLATLRDHNLLARAERPGGEPRFTMLEVVREYAAELLDARSDAGFARLRHAEFFTAQAERAEAAMIGEEQPEWLDRLENEIDNLRAAMSWSLASGAPELALRIMGASRRFWWIRGRIREARRWLEQALAAASPAPSVSASKALSAASAMASLLGDRDQARRYGDEALALARRLDEHVLIISAATNRANAALNDGDYELAEALHLEAAACAARAGASELEGLALSNLSELELERENNARAAELAGRVIELLRQLGNPEWLAGAFANRAHALVRLGRNDEAIEMLRQAAATVSAVDERAGLTTHCLVISAAILAERGDHLAAARLLGLIAALISDTGEMLHRTEAKLHEETLARTKSAVDAATFTAACDEGGEWSADDALLGALAALEATHV